MTKTEHILFQVFFDQINVQYNLKLANYDPAVLNEDILKIIIPNLRYHQKYADLYGQYMLPTYDFVLFCKKNNADDFFAKCFDIFCKYRIENRISTDYELYDLIEYVLFMPYLKIKLTNEHDGSITLLDEEFTQILQWFRNILINNPACVDNILKRHYVAVQCVLKEKPINTKVDNILGWALINGIVKILANWSFSYENTVGKQPGRTAVYRKEKMYDFNKFSPIFYTFPLSENILLENFFINYAIGDRVFFAGYKNADAFVHFVTHKLQFTPDAWHARWDGKVEIYYEDFKDYPSHETRIDALKCVSQNNRHTLLSFLKNVKGDNKKVITEIFGKQPGPL